VTAGGSPPKAGFDAHAASYDEDLARGIALAGEDRSYYARGRVERVAHHLERVGFGRPGLALDFGCGDGASAPLHKEILGSQSVLGVDVSAALLAVARERYAGSGVSFATIAETALQGRCDLAFTNGVFHHIPPAERATALGFVRDALRPGGLFAFFENNPWNPGTRLVMRRIAFDHDAIPIAPYEGRRLLRSAGFEVLAVDSLFYFPRGLRWLRPLEPALARLPLGGQYLVLARRP
jgi:SAM-dependent methyltransferase